MLCIPMIRTNAPSGSSRTPYSVSPRWKLHSRGPNPRKNWVAFIPVALAVTKCPVSWRKTETRMPTANTNIHGLIANSQANRATIPATPIERSATRRARIVVGDLGGHVGDGPAGDDLVAAGARIGSWLQLVRVRHQDASESTSCDARRPGHGRSAATTSSSVEPASTHPRGPARPCTRRRSASTAGSAGEEGLDGDLVGGAQPRRSGAAGASGRVGEVEAAERGAVGGGEVERTERRPVDQPERRSRSLRIAEGVADRQAHVRAC